MLVPDISGTVFEPIVIPQAPATEMAETAMGGAAQEVPAPADGAAGVAEGLASGRVEEPQQPGRGTTQPAAGVAELVSIAPPNPKP